MIFFKKWILPSLIVVILVLAAALTYLLQPSGSLHEFKALIPENETTKPKVDTIDQRFRVHYFGVSTLLFDDGETQILIDGFFSRPSLLHVLFGRIHSSPNKIKDIIQHHQLSRNQAIFVSHSHYDHALDIAELARQLPQTRIIGSQSSLNIARGNKIAESQLTLVKPYEALQFGAFKVTPIPSKHTPATVVNDDLGEEITAPLTLPAHFSAFKEGGSFDYLIEYLGYKILVKASTGAIDQQLKDTQVDTLFLGIAQLSKQSKDYQQHYLQNSLAITKPKRVIPIHWDNFFQGLDQPFEFMPRIADNSPQSLRILIDAAKKQNSKVSLLTQPDAYYFEDDFHTP